MSSALLAASVDISELLFFTLNVKLPDNIAMGKHNSAGVLAHDQDVLLYLQDPEDVCRPAKRSACSG